MISVGSEDKEIHSLDGYGHVDLLLGKNAEQDVYPLVIDWLDQR
jgi:hypothetical protein